MIIFIIIASLLLINFLLLKFSCDCGDSQVKKAKKKKLKVNTPKLFSERKTESHTVFADK